MSDFLSKAIEKNGVAVRGVTFAGDTGDVHFKRITAGQKVELLKGQRVQASSGQSSFEIDLADNANSKAMLVMFSVAKEDGSQYFKDLKAVKAIDAGLMEALYLAASEVNKDELIEGDAGKA